MNIAAGGLAGMPLEEAIRLPIQSLAENLPWTTLGKTGLSAPVLGLGTIFRSPSPTQDWFTDEQADEFIDSVVESGVRMIELAAVYRDAERWFGRALRRHKREKLIISTKSTRVKKEDVMQELEQSLTLLNTDYVDIYMMHNYFTFVHYDQAMDEGGAYEALIQAQEQGKARFIGITGHGSQVTMHAMRSGKFEFFLNPFNPANTEFDRCLHLAAKLKANMLIMKPFGGGSLFRHDEEDPLQLPVTFSAQECLRYVLSHPGVKVVCPNAANLDQFKELVAIAATFQPLDEDERLSIESKAQRLNGGVCGECDKPCEQACPNGIPISYLLSNHQASRRAFHDFFKRGDEYQTLPRDFTDCDREECGLCVGACPHRFEIIKRMEAYHDTIREYRAREGVTYGATYR